MEHPFVCNAIRQSSGAVQAQYNISTLALQGGYADKGWMGNMISGILPLVKLMKWVANMSWHCFPGRFDSNVKKTRELLHAEFESNGIEGKISYKSNKDRIIS